MRSPFDIDWDFGRLESLISSRGDLVIHEKGIACPCRGGDSFASLLTIEEQPGARRKFGCKQCNGLGWVYRDAREIKGLVTGVESGRNRNLLEAGYAVPGDCTFSPSLQAGTIADFDRITFQYPAPTSDGQVIMRNAANLGENAALDLGLSEEEDRLWYYATCVHWCEDENGVTYQPNVDFTVCEKIITWIGNRPSDGVNYTIKYEAFLEWIVYSTPLTRFDLGRSLGQRVLLRKAHVAAQNDYKFNTIQSRQAQVAQEVPSGTAPGVSPGLLGSFRSQWPGVTFTIVPPTSVSGTSPLNVTYIVKDAVSGTPDPSDPVYFESTVVHPQQLTSGSFGGGLYPATMRLYLVVRVENQIGVSESLASPVYRVPGPPNNWLGELYPVV